MNYDAEQVHVRWDLVRALRAPAYIDSAPVPTGPGQPPPTRTAGVLDMRNQSHVPDRLGFWHGNGDGFHAARFDGSAGLERGIEDRWLDPLP